MNDIHVIQEGLISELRNFLTEKWQYSRILSLNRRAPNVGSWRKINKNFKERGDLEVEVPHVECIVKGSCLRKLCSFLRERDLEMKCHYGFMDELVASNIVKESESWRIRVKECAIKDGKIVITLMRENVFKLVLGDIHARGFKYGAMESRGEVIFMSTDHVPEDCDLSLHRLTLTANVLSRTLHKLGYSTATECPTECDFKLLLTLNPALKESNVKTLVFGVVRNVEDHKKEVRIRLDDYRRMREKDMECASIHKYGSSALKPSWKKFVASLADAAVTVDLLCTKPTQPVSLDLRNEFVLCRENSSKGSTFILYNYARLVSILKQFDEKVDNGVYPPLVPVEDADFSLLTTEEEWVLLYCYLLPYPSLLAQLVKPKDLMFDIHMLLQFMQDLCKCLSAYYSRVHILSEPREHLLPMMYSRLHLISGIRILMQSIFTLFDIRPVSQM